MSVVELVKEHFARKDKKEIFEAISPRQKWLNVKQTWVHAHSFVQSMTSRGITGHKVESDVKKTREQSCHGNKELGISPCEARRWSSQGKFYYCDLCGCGEKYIARLDGEGYTKLDYPYLECPLKKPGFSNYDQLVSSNQTRI